CSPLLPRRTSSCAPKSGLPVALFSCCSAFCERSMPRRKPLHWSQARGQRLMETHRILLLSAHPLLSEGLTRLLRDKEDVVLVGPLPVEGFRDRKSTRLNSSHVKISYA